MSAHQDAAKELQVVTGTSPHGCVLVALSGRGVRAVLLGDDPEALRAELQGRFPEASFLPATPEGQAQAARVADHVRDPSGRLDVPLDIGGTAFQRMVWQALRDVPAGTTTTYTEVARRIGRGSAVRAVAQACAANVHAVVIPCHRVVRRDGALSGYRWGVERKRALLAAERK